MKVNAAWNTPISESSRARRKALDLTAIESRVSGILGIPADALRSDVVNTSEALGLHVYLDAEARQILVTDGAVSSSCSVDTAGIDYATHKTIYNAIIMAKGSPRLLDIDIDEFNDL